MWKENTGKNMGTALICLMLFLLAVISLSGCGQKSGADGSFTDPGNDKDFSQLISPEQQEAAYDY